MHFGIAIQSAMDTLDQSQIPPCFSKNSNK